MWVCVRVSMLVYVRCEANKCNIGVTKLLYFICIHLILVWPVCMCTGIVRMHVCYNAMLLLLYEEYWLVVSLLYVWVLMVYCYFQCVPSEYLCDVVFDEQINKSIVWLCTVCVYCILLDVWHITFEEHTFLTKRNWINLLVVWIIFGIEVHFRDCFYVKSYKTVNHNHRYFVIMTNCTHSNNHRRWLIIILIFMIIFFLLLISIMIDIIGISTEINYFFFQLLFFEYSKIRIFFFF